jgi:hypothetical protein
MAYVLPLTAVGDAVYALFQDAQLTALVPGGVQTDVPPDPSYPFLWFEVLHQTNYGGLGTKPGRGSMPGVTLRLHVFQSDYGLMRDAQVVMARAIQLLYPTDNSVPLTLEGYTLAGGQPLSEIETIPLPFEELNGIKVSELVANIDLIVEEIAA